MPFLILSYFDALYGPKVLFKAPEEIEEKIIEEIPKLITIHKEGFFGYIFEDYQSTNIIFKISSPFARGKLQTILLSLLTPNTEKGISTESSKNILEGFILEFQLIKNLSECFSTEENPSKGSMAKIEEVRHFFKNYFHSLKPTFETIKFVEQRYKDLFESATDAIFLVDYELDIIIDMNKRAESLLQNSRELAIGMHFSQIFEISLEDYNILKSKTIENYQSKSPIPIEMAFYFSDRKDFFVEIYATEIDLGGEHIIQYNLHDVTLRKQLERSMEDSERKLTLVLQNSPDLIITIDKDNKIQYINHMPPHIDTNEIIGKNAFEFLMFDDDDLYQMAFSQVFSTGAPETIEVPGFTGLWYRARFIPITQNGSVSTIMLIVSNIPAKII